MCHVFLTFSQDLAVCSLICHNPLTFKTNNPTDFYNAFRASGTEAHFFWGIIMNFCIEPRGYAVLVDDEILVSFPTEAEAEAAVEALTAFTDVSEDIPVTVQEPQPESTEAPNGAYSYE